MNSTTGSGDSANREEGTAWQETVNLLRRVQSGYRAARNQLDNLSQTLAEGEVLINQRLQHVFSASRGYRVLCLVPSGGEVVVSQLGNTVLGGLVSLDTQCRSMRLEVYCLGAFEVRSVQKRARRWQSTKAKSVFEYLVARPKAPVMKDVLMEALWPDCEPQAAGNNLKAAIHGLRQTLGGLFADRDAFPYILFLQGGYLINPELELWIDVEEFEQHWQEGRRLEKEGESDKAIREFELAEALYEGDYLEDELYQEWTLLRREALKDIYVTILGKLADYCFNTFDYESCIIYCQKILAKDACREDAYRRLMRCYSRMGQNNRALDWYEICSQTIKAELNAPTDAETDALYRQLVINKPI